MYLTNGIRYVSPEFPGISTALFQTAGFECCRKYETFWGLTINYKKKGHSGTDGA
ncbi:MAG: hypothetical protein KC618_06210 [Candidatus Omnitrophica bacterium]|nr:hypothetical protein [Candidatus Omnitrophota bacterium]